MTKRNTDKKKSMRQRRGTSKGGRRRSTVATKRTPAPEKVGHPASPAASSGTEIVRPAPAIPIVGLGASAGALEALEAFFAAAPRDSGLAYVVVQHLERHHPSLLPGLLAQRTRMPVRQAVDGDLLERDTVFVIPPNALLTVSAGALKVSPLGDEPRMLVDTFLRSLAEDRGDLGIGVLLSGTGTDGTLGLRAIREQGGLTLAQRPDTAKHAAMPQNAIAAGFVDEVLDVGAMPARLIEHARRIGDGRANRSAAESEVRSGLGRICELLRQRTGHDFGCYKEGTLLRRIRRRIQLLRLASAADYLHQLEESPDEPGLLLRDLLIGVTQFFREPDAFETLTRKVLVELVREKANDRPIRIWVPGCATGEEVYSLAILLHEQFAVLRARRPVQIFATDIDTEALAIARAGRYGADVAEQVSPERLERFFVRCEGGYQVVNELRDMCVFSAHNLIRDPPFSSLDLITCRNVLIYFAPDLQKKVIPLFHYALRRSGYLFLGSSEELSGHSALFAPLDKKARVFQRKDAVTRPIPAFPLAGLRAPRGVEPPSAMPASARGARQTIQQGFERMILEDFSPASAIVDERGEMLCLAGRLAPLLAPPIGSVTNNILDFAQGSVRHAIRTALAEAAAKRAEIVRPEVLADLGSDPHRLRLTVRPAPGVSSDTGLFAVIVEDLGPARVTRLARAAVRSQEPMIEQLEDELKAMRADLQAANEELEGANEELKSANEELISTNEELQSTNEELQTSSEELQSVNEELETVNAELRQKLQELGVANSDLQNLFSSTQVATIFLDRELRLTKFTPAATAQFRFIDSDLGRPLSDLAPRFAGTNLIADVDEVFRTLAPVEREVRSGEAWFILRVMPYRTLDDAVAGAVITFSDVTRLKRAEAALRESERLLKDVIDTSPSIIFLKDLQGRFLTINRRLEAMLGMSREQLKGKTDYDLFPPDRAEFYREHDRRVAETRRAIDVEETADLADGHHVFLASKFPLVDSAGRVYGVGAISHDITERKRADELVRRYAGLLRLSQDAIFVRRASGEIEFWNDGAQRLYGFTEAEAEGQNAHAFLQTLFPGSLEELDALLKTQGSWDGELVHRAKDGRMVTVAARMQLLRGEDGVDRILQSCRDITEAKQAEGRLRQAVAEAQRRAAEIDAIVQALPHAVYFGDQNGISRCNANALQMLGAASLEDLQQRIGELGEKFRVRYRPDGGLVEPEKLPFNRALSGERASLDTWATRASDGSDVLIRGNSAPVVVDGKPIGAVAVNIDITDQYRMQQALREADARKNDFLATLSHELRNPLTPIKNSLHILEHARGDVEAKQRALAVMRRQLAQLTGLIEDLLDVTRISRGKVRLDLEPLEFGELVAGAVEDQRDAFAKRKIDLVLEVVGAPLWIRADRRRIAQVVSNLLQNAAKFTPEGGSTTVSVQAAPDDRAALRVRDTGVGIAADVLPLLFQPFTQAESTLDRSRGGLGLGLALVKGIVELHGGAVAARSEGPGKGAELEVVLPTVSGVTSTQAASAALARVAPRRVLIVEDDLDAAETLRNALELGHHDVSVAHSAEQGLEMVSALRPEVVLCDLSLPGPLDGDGLARAVRADGALAGVRLVALVASAGVEEVERSRQAGFHHWLAKPIDFSALEQILANPEESSR